MMKISIGCDHAGFKLKSNVVARLKELNYEIMDFGTYSEESVDYPDFAFPTAESVASGESKFGVLICGTGIGVSITANKVEGIRAANCCNEEMAKMARLHNDANMIALGARLVDLETAMNLIKIFLETEFEGGRHTKRVEKIHSLTGL